MHLPSLECLSPEWATTILLHHHLVQVSAPFGILELLAVSKAMRMPRFSLPRLRTCRLPPAPKTLTGFSSNPFLGDWRLRYTGPTREVGNHPLHVPQGLPSFPSSTHPSTGSSAVLWYLQGTLDLCRLVVTFNITFVRWSIIIILLVHPNHSTNFETRYILEKHRALHNR